MSDAVRRFSLRWNNLSGSCKPQFLLLPLVDQRMLIKDSRIVEAFGGFDEVRDGTETRVKMTYGLAMCRSSEL